MSDGYHPRQASTRGGIDVSNGRSFRRALSATFVGAALVASSSASPAGADQPASPAEADSVTPVLWQGTLSDHSRDAVVNVRVDALSDDVSGDDAFVTLDGATADEEGITTIRAEPGDWYDRLKDEDGRVQVTLFAGADDGDRFGMELLYLRWVEADDTNTGHWVSDEQRISEQANQEQAASERNQAASDTRSSPLDRPPSSEINMVETPEELASSSHSGDLAAHETQSISIGSYTCDGARHLLDSAPNWVTVGKYYSAGGPTEHWTYETNSTTSTAWGFSGEAGVGPFTLGGKAVFEKGSTTSTGGGGQIAADTDKPWGLEQVQVEYRLYRVDGCRQGPPTGTNPGGSETKSLTQLVPHRFTSGVKNGKLPNVGSTPQRVSAYTRTINPQTNQFRANGVTTSTSGSLDVEVGWSGGLASLSGGISVTTSSSQGQSIKRSWHNPSGSAVKYIDSTAGVPTLTGTHQVRGFNG